ncbi:hypothetical protein [Anaerotignum sp.]|uniref:hypothetical protein n=1 Tax=Anaerotignum sp. TaxID=2039241 RepID=UPI003735E8EB
MSKQNIRELTILGLLTAILFLGQVFLAVLPNVEVVSLLIILYTLTCGRKVFLIIYAFVLLEGFCYGFGMWWFSYLYLWSILALAAYIFRENRSLLFWSILSGFFGLAFGALCTLPYLVVGGIGAALAYWTSGLLFDVTHCIGNFIVCLVLFRPLRHLLERLYTGCHTPL